MNDPYQPPPEPRPPAYPGYGSQPAAPPQAGARMVRVQQPAVQPVVTYTLLGITVLVFALQFLSPYLFGVEDLPAVLGMKVNSLIVGGQYWRLFTPMFLHSGILHIAFNMYALMIFGPGLERHYRHLRFLTLYVLAGFAGNVTSFLFSPANSLGSSTAIFGLLGAEAVFLYRNRELLGQGARRALTNILTVAGINLVIGLSPGIDNWGHIGGLIGGTLFAWFGGPVLAVEGSEPNYHLVDQRPTWQVVLAAVLVGLGFAILAFLSIQSRGG
jgi:rhomboid protease GluP